MEDLYPIAEEGPKCRGRQSIKLRRRFEPQGDGLNAQLGRTFTHTKKRKNLDDPPGVRVTTLTTLNTDYIISQKVVFHITTLIYTACWKYA